MESLTDSFLSLEDDYIECKRSINNTLNEIEQAEMGDDVQGMNRKAQANIVEAQRYVRKRRMTIKDYQELLKTHVDEVDEYRS